MGLFVVQHRHLEEKCPARDSQMAPMLLSHLSSENARKHGLAIKAEAVIDGAHTLYLIVEAAGKQDVERFMEPFAIAGSVEVLPASHCEIVVKRGFC